jgi:enamine deaminase RidA (YjgF/YER057c/UK114 family)
VWPEGVYRLGNWDDPACAQVVEVRRTGPGRSVHVAGTYAKDVHGKIDQPSDMASQVSAAMENIRLSLAAVDATPADVVRVKTYVTDMEAFKAEGVPVFQRFWHEHSPDGPPVSTAVQISRLGEPTALVEMEVYAELQD